MKDNFDRCLPHILRHEGGWADHPKDPGGATMKGITIATYEAWKRRKVTKAELKAISNEEVAAIYRKNYWDAVRADELPAGLDLVVFDAAVNSGPSRSVKWLQQALGVTSDGRIGPKTIAAAKDADAATIANAALDNRLRFLRSVKTWDTFGRGWLNRVGSIRNAMIYMTRETPKPAPTPSQAPAKASPRVGAGLGIAAIIAAAGAAVWAALPEWMTNWITG